MYSPRKKVITGHVQIIIVPKFSQNSPRGFITSTLNKQTMKVEEALQRNTVILDAVIEIFVQHRLDVIQNLRLERGIEAPALKIIKFNVIQEPIVVNITDLEDADQSSLARVCQLKRNWLINFIVHWTMFENK